MEQKTGGVQASPLTWARVGVGPIWARVCWVDTWGSSWAPEQGPEIMEHKNSHEFYDSPNSYRSPVFTAVVDCKMCRMKYL